MEVKASLNVSGHDNESNCGSLPHCIVTTHVDKKLWSSKNDNHTQFPHSSTSDKEVYHDTCEILFQ